MSCNPHKLKFFFSSSRLKLLRDKTGSPWRQTHSTSVRALQSRVVTNSFNICTTAFKHMPDVRLHQITAAAAARLQWAKVSVDHVGSAHACKHTEVKMPPRLKLHNQIQHQIWVWSKLSDPFPSNAERYLTCVSCQLKQVKLAGRILLGTSDRVQRTFQKRPVLKQGKNVTTRPPDVHLRLTELYRVTWGKPQHPRRWSQ